MANAAPMVIDLGTQDLSTTPAIRTPTQIPQHLPKFYLYTQKGPTTPQLVVGAERSLMYGVNSFDLRSPWANHATVFANGVNDQGNACMIQRVVPNDAGPNSNMLLWLDVLPCPVDLYQRNTDGSITIVNGAPVVTGTTQGYKVKWVVTHYNTVQSLNNNFGRAAITAGDQVYTQGATSVQSQRYPIYGFKGAFIGGYGNLCGLRIWAPTKLTSTAMPTKLMAKERAYPYNVQFIRQTDPNTTPVIVPTIFADQFTTVVSKEATIDPSTNKEIFIGTVLLNNYQNLTDTLYPPVYGDFSTMEIYQNNVDLLLGLFHQAEAPHIDIWSDFSAAVTDKHLFNFVSGTSSEGVLYHSYQFVDASNAVRLTEYTNIFADGGQDGTMTDANFAVLVGQQLDRYIDPNDPLQEDAVHVESVFYDSGFPLEIKYKLASFIAARKDTFVHLSPHDVNERIMNASEEHSIAIALRTRLQMYPESSHFGTPVMRAMITGRCAKIRNSLYKKYLPLTYEIAIMSAKYMGAGNGRWKQGSNFDGAPGHIVTTMYDISIPWVPATVRNQNWDVGLNWVQQYDRELFFFPSYKTVYTDDTSVLNSYLTAIAICQLVKITHAAWREYAGVSHLTNDQLIERVNNFIKNRTSGRFDERFVIVPATVVTDEDAQRGYSYTSVIKIYSANMKTVMTAYIEAHRLDSITTA